MKQADIGKGRNNEASKRTGKQSPRLKQSRRTSAQSLEIMIIVIIYQLLPAIGQTH